MNSILKHMFEEDCSIEEAKMNAAILGKSYEECKQDWEQLFKKEFVLANSNILIKYNYVADQNGMFNFVIAIYYDDLLTNKIMKCNGISCNRIREGAFLLTISFYESELDTEFLKQVLEKNRKIYGTMITSVFSLQEIKYAYNHRYIYDQLLKCTSPEEFVMTLDIMRCSMSFPITDFKAIISEVIENYYMLGIKANHKPEIILDLIKNYSIFDDAIKTTQLPKLVLKIRSKLEPSMQRYKICQMFLAVMFNKFPELFTMQFNYRKRNKIKYQRFTENDMKKYLV